LLRTQFFGHPAPSSSWPSGQFDLLWETKFFLSHDLVRTLFGQLFEVFGQLLGLVALRGTSEPPWWQTD